MTSKKYHELDEFQQKIYDTMLLHAVKHDDDYFTAGLIIIEEAKSDGMFDKIKFGAHDVFKDEIPHP